METLIKEVANLRQKCHRYGDNIDSVFTKPLTSDPISGCFAAMFNFATLTDGITISFVKGKMLRGKLDFFVKLTNKAVDLYYSHACIVQLIKQ